MSWLDYFLDFLFPKKCLGCKKEGDWFCPLCRKKIEYCVPSLERFPRSPLEGVVAIGYFRGLLREAIHLFKYEKTRELAKELGDLFVSELQKPENCFLLKWIFVPVPLHRAKQRERGFNQAELLLYQVYQKLAIKTLRNNLIKIKNTPSQMQLKKKERLNNLKGAFAVLEKRQWEGKNIVLIDDVMTTGATLTECAKVLKKAGAKRVFGLVLAR